MAHMMTGYTPALLVHLFIFVVFKVHIWPLDGKRKQSDQLITQHPNIFVTLWPAFLLHTTTKIYKPNKIFPKKQENKSKWAEPAFAILAVRHSQITKRKI